MWSARVNGMTRFVFTVVLMLAAGLSVCAANESTVPPKPDAACAACHGAGGNQPISPEIPRLAGQEYDYLVQALMQYRGGARQNPIMGAMAKSLSDTQIRNLARYYSARPGLTTKY
jgi:cytochrome c553